MRTALLAFALTTSVFGSAAGAQQADQAMPASPRPMRGGQMGGMGGMGGMAGLMRADTNHDGIITREEAVASSDLMFDRLDANHDGMVTPDEMRATRDAMRPAGAPPAGDMGATAPPPPAGAPMGRTLSRQQWHDRALGQFDRLDANHDGKVDQTEIATYQQAMRERRQERRGDTPPPPPAPPMGQQ